MDMFRPDRIFCLLASTAILICFPGTGMCASPDDMRQCLQDALRTAGENTTVGELRKQCEEKIDASESDSTATTSDPPGAVRRRLVADEKNVLDPFALMAHNPNYFIFTSYTSGGIDPEPFREQFEDSRIDADDIEARFQISVKAPLGVNLFAKPLDLFVAYTNRSFWQVYNDDASAPFRETNHEPEIWLQHRQDRKLPGFRNSVNILGLVHQSNGRGGTLSRSWNRIYANLVFESSNVLAEGDTLGLSIKPWLRLPENDEDDDNSDITDFMGHGRLGLAYKYGDHVFSLMLRNHIESGFSKGAVETAWSFPLWKYPYLKGYVKWFNGYGESLIDYNVHNNSIGIGILLTDWL